MDLRIEKTQKSIINTFIELRSKKPIEKITVKELCEKAQINKSTFYSHYHDIYDLSEYLENETVASLVESLSHPEYMLENPEAFTRELFECCLAKDILISILFSGSRSSLFVDKLEKTLKDLIFSKALQYRNDPEKNIILTYSIYGGYYTFYKNRIYGAEAVIDIIGKLSSKIEYNTSL